MLFPIGDDNTDRRTTPYVNYLLIAINIFVFVFLQGMGQNARFTYAYATVPEEILTGRDVVTRDRVVTDPGSGEKFTVPGLQRTPIPVFLTLITAMFMHGGIAHILGNMLYLWIFGDNVEDRLGHIGYLIFYLFCGLVASAAQIIVDPSSTVPNLGASGAIAGVLGAYLVFYPGARVRTLVWVGFFVTFARLSAIIVIGLWFVLQLISGLQSLNPDALSSGGGIAYFAHIGGFVAGFVIALLLRPMLRPSKRYDLTYPNWPAHPDYPSYR